MDSSGAIRTRRTGGAPLPSQAEIKSAGESASKDPSGRDKNFACLKSSPGSWNSNPPRSSEQRAADLIKYAEETFRDAVQDVWRKEQRRIEVTTAALAAKKRVAAAFNTKQQLATMLKSTKVRYVLPAAATLKRVTKVWNDQHADLSAAQGRARQRASAIRDAEVKLRMAQSALGAVQRSYIAAQAHLHTPPLLCDYQDILAAERREERTLRAAQNAARIADTRVRTKRAAAEEAANFVDACAVERFCVWEERTQAEQRYRVVKKTHDDLVVKLLNAAKAEASVRAEEQARLELCTKPYRDLIAARRRATRTRDTFVMMINRGDGEASRTSRFPAAPQGTSASTKTSSTAAGELAVADTPPRGVKRGRETEGAAYAQTSTSAQTASTAAGELTATDVPSEGVKRRQETEGVVCAQNIGVGSRKRSQTDGENDGGSSKRTRTGSGNVDEPFCMAQASTGAQEESVSGTMSHAGV